MFDRVSCLLWIMPGPGSFTGDDSAEIAVAGNPDLVAKLEKRLLEAGANVRRANPGEFTWRAFLNGRIDLAQAEGIAATIAASTDEQLRAARQLADGALGRFVRGLADRIADDLALVEAGIDFTDQDDVVAIAPATLRAHLRDAVGAIRVRLAHAVPAERVDAVPRVVLAGPPNAGKSTLFNALLGRTRTVVSPHAGTTRDAIVEPTSVPAPAGALPIRLVDVAGLDDSRDVHAPAMNLVARRAIESADLVVWCVPPGEHAPTIGPRSIAVHTKCDIAPRGGLCVSGRSGEGLDDLRRTIGERLAARLAGAASEAVFLTERHESLLSEAVSHLERAIETTAPELVAASLRLALDALGGITGAIAPDDVLGRIFGKFCIGK